jgi:hypothetical protein
VKSFNAFPGRSTREEISSSAVLRRAANYKRRTISCTPEPLLRAVEDGKDSACHGLWAVQAPQSACHILRLGHLKNVA